MKPIQVPADGGKPVNILGIPMWIRIQGRDTNGTLAVVESHDSPGGGPPPHIHQREDETFQVLAGEYEFMVGGQTILAQSGTSLFAPRGIAHTYRCVSSKGGKLSVVLTPAGLEGFFAEVGAMSPQQQQDISRIVELGKKYGLEFLPPPAA